MFAMSGDGTDDVDVAALFLFNREGKKLLLAYQAHPELHVYMGHKAKTLGAWGQGGWARCKGGGELLHVQH